MRQVAAGCEFYERLTADLSVVETGGKRDRERERQGLDTGAGCRVVSSLLSLLPFEQDEPRDTWYGSWKRSIRGTIYRFRFSSGHPAEPVIHSSRVRLFPRRRCIDLRRRQRYTFLLASRASLARDRSTSACPLGFLSTLVTLLFVTVFREIKKKKKRKRKRHSDEQRNREKRFLSWLIFGFQAVAIWNNLRLINEERKSTM